jgi:hypothetical protein
MSSQGFIVNDAEVASIQATYKSSLLHEDEVSDANSIFGSLPGASWWSQLELVFDVTAGAVSEITVKVTWDSTGDDPALEEMILTTADGSLFAGQTDTSLLLAVQNINAPKRSTANQTTRGKVYLWAKVSDGAGGTVTLKKARLQWYIPSTGGR